jgi:hypothetical protein
MLTRTRYSHLFALTLSLPLFAAGCDTAPPAVAPATAQAALTVDPAPDGAIAAALPGPLKVLAVAATDRTGAIPLNAALSLAENADALAAALADKLRDPCPAVSVSHDLGTASLSIDFGSGCTVAGHTISGQVTATAYEATPYRYPGYSLILTSVQVDGLSADGSLWVYDPPAAGIYVGFDVTGNDGRAAFSGSFTLDADRKGVTFSGEGSYHPADEPAAVDFTAEGVHYAFGACYPDAGSLTIRRDPVRPGPAPEVVITFLSTTPSDGIVQVSIGPVTAPKGLPAYGSCP